MPPNFREWIHTIAELNMHMHVSRLVHIKMLQNELTTGPNISHAILLAIYEVCPEHMLQQRRTYHCQIFE